MSDLQDAKDWIQRAGEMLAKPDGKSASTLMYDRKTIDFVQKYLNEAMEIIEKEK